MIDNGKHDWVFWVSGLMLSVCVATFVMWLTFYVREVMYARGLASLSEVNYLHSYSAFSFLSAMWAGGLIWVMVRHSPAKILSMKLLALAMLIVGCYVAFLLRYCAFIWAYLDSDYYSAQFQAIFKLTKNPLFPGLDWQYFIVFALAVFVFAGLSRKFKSSWLWRFILIALAWCCALGCYGYFCYWNYRLNAQYWPDFIFENAVLHAQFFLTFLFTLITVWFLDWLFSYLKMRIERDQS